MKNKIAVIGLGYVGLPLAVEFGKKFETFGFDIDKARIEDLKQGIDITLEVDFDELKKAVFLNYTSDSEDIQGCNIYIVTVPTPIDKHKRPDLTPLIQASKRLGSLLNKGDIVI